jgi:hypothetical protein
VTSLEKLCSDFTYQVPGSAKNRLPTDQQVNTLCEALSSDSAADDLIISAPAKGGVAIDTIYLGYVAGCCQAARRTGTKIEFRSWT